MFKRPDFDAAAFAGFARSCADCGKVCEVKGVGAGGRHARSAPGAGAPRQGYVPGQGVQGRGHPPRRCFNSRPPGL